MRLFTLLIGLFLLCCCAVMAPKVASATDGKSLFESSKCSDCHSIAAEAIAVAASEDADEEDPFGGEEDGEEEDDAPDLSGIGKKHDAKWLADYLKKKIANEDGKKHRKRFKGSNDALKTLSEYLAGLKTDAPAP